MRFYDSRTAAYKCQLCDFESSGDSAMVKIVEHVELIHKEMFGHAMKDPNYVTTVCSNLQSNGRSSSARKRRSSSAVLMAGKQ
uniref:Uncharacterized protein n=1 Tax=Ditylenchus dipsaci TaxID=166011 RepID=A0A915DK72_9BILA